MMTLVPIYRANALQFPGEQRMPATKDEASHPLQRGLIVYSAGMAVHELAGERFWVEGKLRQPRAFVFLLAMAAVSVACKVGERLICNTLLAWLGLTFDPFLLSVALQAAVTLVGIGAASRFSKATPGPAARGHLLVTLLAAMGIGLILAWLSRLAGYTKALDWPLVLVYLLWAWAAAVSAA
jgi:hypothetical protein